MSYPLDEAETLNSLGRQIHHMSAAKGFYEPCPACSGKGLLNSDIPADLETIKFNYPERTALHAPGVNVVCPTCKGRRSDFIPEDFHKKLGHIVREVMEIFDLEREAPLEKVISFTGTPGVAATPGYDSPNVCFPLVPDKHLPAHPAIAVEIADSLIRLLDMGYWLGLDVGAAVADKIKFNGGRPHKHGKRH